MAPLPGTLWRWVPGRVASFICLLFTPEDVLQVDGEEGGVEGAWAPRVKGATDTCKFPPLFFFFFLLCSRALGPFRVGTMPEPQGHLFLGWEPCLGCSIMP